MRGMSIAKRLKVVVERHREDHDPETWRKEKRKGNQYSSTTWPISRDYTMYLHVFTVYDVDIRRKIIIYQKESVQAYAWKRISNPKCKASIYYTYIYMYIYLTGLQSFKH